MGISNFDIIQANAYLGLPETSSGSSSAGAKEFWVNASTVTADGAVGGSDNNSGTSPLEPFATIGKALTLSKTSRGDVTKVAASHAITVATAGGLTLDKANIHLIGDKHGHKMPTITFSDTAASIVISGNGCSFKNFILTPSVDSVVSPLVITGNDVEIDVVIKDASNAVEFVRGITCIGVVRAGLKLKHIGFTDGDACVNAVRLTNCKDIDIVTDFNGKASTGVVEFITTASTDVKVSGYMYNASVADGSKDVVNTGALACTWLGRVEDGVVGGMMSGGSGQAWASDDVFAIAADVTAIKAVTDLLPNAGALTSLAQDATVAKEATVTAGFAAGAFDATVAKEATSTLIKTETDQIGTIVNTGGTATVGGCFGDLTNKTFVNRFDSIFNVINTIPLGNFTQKTIFYDGSASYNAFNTTGVVAVKIVGQVTGALSAVVATTDVATASGGNGSLLPATAANLLGNVNNIWADATPSNFEAFDTAGGYSIVSGSETITVDGDATIAAGTIALTCLWYGFGPGSTVTPAP